MNEQQIAIEILNNLIQSARILRKESYEDTLQSHREFFQQVMDGSEFTVFVAGDSDHAERLVHRLLNLPVVEKDEITPMSEVVTDSEMFNGVKTRFITVSLSEIEPDAPEVTTRLDKANVVLIATDVSRLLTQPERQVALRFATNTPRPLVMIAVVNSDNVQADAMEGVRTLLRESLRPLFTVSGGELDETLFNTRVYFLDQTEKSTVLLRQALSGAAIPENQLAMAHAMSLSTVEEFVEEVKSQMVDFTVSDEPALAVEMDEDEMRGHLADFSLALRANLLSDLYHYADDMYNSWEQDAPRFIRLDPRRVLTALPTSLLGRDNRMYLLEDSIRAYLVAKFKEWEPRAQALIEAEREALQQRVTSRMFDLQTAEIAESARIHVVTMEQQQQIFSELGRLIILGGKRAEDQMVRWLGRTILGYFVFTATPVLVTQISVTLLILSEALNLRRRTEDFNHIVLNNLRDSIRKTLKDSVTFDGIQAGQLTSPREFIDYVRQQREPLSQFVYQSLPTDLHNTQYAKFSQDTAHIRLADALNTLTLGDLIYTRERFAHVRLKPEVDFALRETDRSSDDTQALNRILLSEAYPRYITPKISDRLNTLIDFKIMSAFELTRETESNGSTKDTPTSINQPFAEIAQTVSEQADIFRTLQFSREA